MQEDFEATLNENGVIFPKAKKDCVLRMLIEAQKYLEESFTPTICEDSWMLTGLVPFDLNRILLRWGTNYFSELYELTRKKLTFC